MEALRGVELTGTNCSIGLIFRNSCVVVNASCGLKIRNIPEFKTTNLRSLWFLYIASFRRPGGYGGGSPPDPIPDSAVKSPSADGTAS